MKSIYALFLVLLIILSCNVEVKKEIRDSEHLPLEGTWALVSGQTIIKNDTTFADYTKGKKMIKIINATHFAFLRHDLDHGKDSTTADYAAGGGTYTLAGDEYTENLEYFNDRNWEGHSFHFKVRVINDTLIQTGIEKLDSLGIDQQIIEKYVKVGK
jgi:hypothetical protein